MYILTITAKRKGGKRHIVNKSTNIEDLKIYAKNLNDYYIVEIYNGKWELIERVK